MKKWILIALTGFYFCSCTKEPLVLFYVIDGLQTDAAGVAATSGAENLRFLMENGVTVKEAYCTSPAPRMYLPDGTLPWGTSSSPNVAMHTGTHIFESRKMDDIFIGNPEITYHPKMILRYLRSKNGKISDEYSEYRQTMLSFIKELDP